MSIDIHDLDLPARGDEPSTAGAAFRERTELVTRRNDGLYGAGIVSVTPQESLVGATSTRDTRLVHRVARLDGRIVGVLTIWLGHTESTDVLDFAADVDPALPVETQRTVHEALVADAVGHSSALGRPTLIAASVADAAGPVTAATGFGGADPDDPGVAPLVERGLLLEQVCRISALTLADLDDLDARLEAARERSEGYEVLAWVGDTPAAHRERMLRLFERMSTDAPMGDLAVEPEVWDEQRLATFEQRQRDGGRIVLTVAARKVVTGELAGFSNLFVPPAGDVAKQHDTLVAKEHRGHRLGMLLKLANLRALREHPHITRVTTWNAEENRPMLSVNEHVGFRPIGYEGIWQRKASS